jgi:methyltransferase-like protein 6
LSEANPKLNIFACDFAEKAIELLKEDDRYTTGRCKAFVADLTADDLSQSIPAGSIDIVTCIFVFSALPPEKFSQAIDNIKKVLKPGGLILFRDYCTDDAAQKRFKDDRKLADTLFVRQDGTLAYYFDKDELEGMFTEKGFTVDLCDVIHSKTTNIKRDIDLDRYFLQAKFHFERDRYDMKR